jgi:hypothetical protein
MKYGLPQLILTRYRLLNAADKNWHANHRQFYCLNQAGFRLGNPTSLLISLKS